MNINPRSDCMGTKSQDATGTWIEVPNKIGVESWFYLFNTVGPAQEWVNSSGGPRYVWVLTAAGPEVRGEYRSEHQS